MLGFVRVGGSGDAWHECGWRQEGEWPADSVPVESLRLWDTGTPWLQIVATRGRYEWRLLDTALQTAASAGVTDVLTVRGPAPVWNAISFSCGRSPVSMEGGTADSS